MILVSDALRITFVEEFDLLLVTMITASDESTIGFTMLVTSLPVMIYYNRRRSHRRNLQFKRLLKPRFSVNLPWTLEVRGNGSRDWCWGPAGYYFRGSEGTPFSLLFSLLIGLISFSKFTIQYQNDEVVCSVLPTTHSFFIFLNVPIGELFRSNPINRKKGFFFSHRFPDQLKFTIFGRFHFLKKTKN